MARIYVSDIIDAPVEKVWAIARDFEAHDKWHPRIAESSIEGGGPPDQVGCVRAFTLSDGGFLREQLLTFSEQDRFFVYTILESPMPIENYIASLRCTPITERSATFVEWTATYEVGPDDADAIRHAVGRETFAAGIKALAKAIGT